MTISLSHARTTQSYLQRSKILHEPQQSRPSSVQWNHFPDHPRSTLCRESPVKLPGPQKEGMDCFLFRENLAFGIALHVPKTSPKKKLHAEPSCFRNSWFHNISWWKRLETAINSQQPHPMHAFCQTVKSHPPVALGSLPLDAFSTQRNHHKHPTRCSNTSLCSHQYGSSKHQKIDKPGVFTVNVFKLVILTVPFFGARTPRWQKIYCI